MDDRTTVTYGSHIYKENLVQIMLDNLEELEQYSVTHKNIYQRRIMVIRDLLESMQEV